MHCASLPIMVEAQGLIANVMTANVDELELRDKWYFQGIRVGTHTVDFPLNPCVQDHQLLYPAKKCLTVMNKSVKVRRHNTRKTYESHRLINPRYLC